MHNQIKINYGSKGSAYIREWGKPGEWDNYRWHTDYEHIIRESNSIVEAIRESKKEIEQFCEEFGEIDEMQPDNSWILQEPFDPNHF